ncbi:hypothetical protein HMPREF1141_1375 [Clostridium sp. MSTE9]|nr:hypothetical protein HMPREF1141_1375 [Clostridium sp. MSTE9]
MFPLPAFRFTEHGRIFAELPAKSACSRWRFLSVAFVSGTSPACSI